MNRKFHKELHGAKALTIPVPDSWKERALFLFNFIKNPVRNASVIPSSKEASGEMMSGIDWAEINTIVELGPGNGTFTKEILARCKPGTKVILFELEDSYVDLLHTKFGNKVEIMHKSAHLFEDVLQEKNLSKADLIISGLPFLSKTLNQLIFHAIMNQTDKGAIFRFFTYMPPIMRLVYKGVDLKKVSFVWRNIPPMWIYGIN